MKEYIVIKLYNNVLSYDYRSITKDEKKYLNKNSFYKDTLFYTLNYFKNHISKISKFFSSIDYLVVKRYVTFKYVIEFMNKCKINKIRLLFKSTISLEDYNSLLNINYLSEIDVYYIPGFIYEKFKNLGINVLTHNEYKISDEFLLEQDCFDYDTLYYRKQLVITHEFNSLDDDLIEFFRINYYLKSIDIYYYSNTLIERVIKCLEEDNTNNILILLHEVADKGNYISNNFRYLKSLNEKYKCNKLCEFKIIYSNNFIKNNLFKQLTYNNLKLICILFIYLSFSSFIIYKAYNDVSSLNNSRYKYELMNNNVSSTFVLNDEDEVINNSITEDNEQNTEEYENNLNKSINALLSINNETVGYLSINNTNISYPVVKHSDNSYYLNHDFYHNYSYSGWVFLDYRNSGNVIDRNNIIYAHSMLNGTMFGTLKKTLESSFRNNEDNMIISYRLLDKECKFKIFSVYKVDYTTDYLKTNFDSDSEYIEFLNMIKERSIFNSNIYLDSSSKILTLSTCTGTNNRRLVVHALLMED